MSNIPNKIIIHHSAGPDNLYLKDFDAIRNYHINVNKWKDIGYHYVIESVANEYKIIPGRAESMEGAHCPGQNQQSIGICVVGDFSDVEPTDAQYLTLVYCIKDIYKRYGELPIYGHRDFYNTECPGKLNIYKVRNLVNPAQEPEQPKVHWAQPAYDYINSHGIHINETRFDDPITRGEYFAVLAQQMGWNP